MILTACDAAPVQRVDLDEAAEEDGSPASPSPDTEGAIWAVTKGGTAIAFGHDGASPFLSLTCAIGKEGAEPKLTIARHVVPDPGAKALFPVIGNGVISRFKVDAALSDGEWRWEGTYPAAAGEFDVFTGPRPIEATLPGGGMLKLPASTLPREFIDWCRRNGEDLPMDEASQDRSNVDEVRSP